MSQVTDQKGNSEVDTHLQVQVTLIKSRFVLNLNAINIESPSTGGKWLYIVYVSTDRPTPEKDIQIQISRDKTDWELLKPILTTNSAGVARSPTRFEKPYIGDTFYVRAFFQGDQEYVEVYSEVETKVAKST